MSKPVLGWFRQFKQARRGRKAVPRAVAASTGLEPLEPRVLLSGVGLGSLPNLVDVGNGLGFLTSTFSINLPETVSEQPGSRVSGSVFADTDGDALRDPLEYALEGVKVFADIDGDGKLSDAEPSSVTGTAGNFYLNNLPIGDYSVRVQLPDGYKTTQAGSDTASVTVTETAGVGGLSFALAQSGYDLSIELSDVSLPGKLKTGTRVTVPVIVTNQGDTPLPAGDIKLRVFVSGDATRSKDDVRLTKVALKESLLPGQSIKLDLDVALLSAAADFQSYLIVDAVGKSLRGDLDRTNNTTVSDERLNFTVTDRPTFLTPDLLSFVLGVWNQAVPFGNLAPGLGFNDGGVLVQDLNIVLANWNVGIPHAPSGPAYTGEPRIDTVRIEGGNLVLGEPAVITARGVTDRDGTIDRVLFYYDRDGDSVADDLLGVDSDGSDGYSIVTDRVGNQLFNDSSNATVIAVAQDNDGKLGARSQSAELRIGVEISKDKRLVYREADGTVVTLAMTGPGSARVLLAGTGVRAWDLGDTVELTGDARVDRIQLEQTTAKSKLMIRASGGKATIAGSITGSTPLGVLAARRVEINGGIRMTGQGTIRKLRAANLNWIVMEGTAFDGRVDIKVDRASGLAQIASSIRSIKAGSLTNFRLEAPSVKKIIVRDNYAGGSVTLTDPDVRFSLMQLTVGETMRDVQVRAASSIRTVTASSMRGSQLLAGNSADPVLEAAGLFPPLPAPVLVPASTTDSTPATVEPVVPQRRAILNLNVGGAFTDSFVSAWRLGRVNLDSASQDNPNSLFGLVYHRLKRYAGPLDIDRTVI